MSELDNYLIASKVYYDKVFDRVEHSNVINGVDVELHFKYLKRPLNIPCQVNSDRRNPITPELKF